MRLCGVSRVRERGMMWDIIRKKREELLRRGGVEGEARFGFRQALFSRRG